MIKQKRVKVTQKHIKRGIPGNAESCPIALALLSRKDVDHVEVDGTEVVIRDRKGKQCHYEVPVRAENFIYKFDDGEKVNPFSFRLGKVMEAYDADGNEI